MKIDILMATYNGEKYIREQIDSILSQSYSDFRLMISDDCSTDSTRDILIEYAQKDNRIKLFFQEFNLGIVKNFEYLMKRVESDCFMFSDQDDVWKSDKILKTISLMKVTNSDLIYTDLEVVDQDLKLINSSYISLKGFDKKVKYNNFESLYLNNYITGSTMLVKSEWIDKIVPLPSESKFILHDYWTALVVSKLGKMTYLDEPLVKYRQHGKNEIGSKRKSDEIEDFDDIRELFITVKLDHFKTFIKHEYAFKDEKLEEVNKRAYAYFETLQDVRKISFKGTNLFKELYKYEKIKYSFENYLILNMPLIARILFKIKKRIGNKNERK